MQTIGCKIHATTKPIMNRLTQEKLASVKTQPRVDIHIDSYAGESIKIERVYSQLEDSTGLIAERRTNINTGEVIVTRHLTNGLKMRIGIIGPIERPNDYPDNDRRANEVSVRIYAHNNPDAYLFDAVYGSGTRLEGKLKYFKTGVVSHDVTDLVKRDIEAISGQDVGIGTNLLIKRFVEEATKLPWNMSHFVGSLLSLPKDVLGSMRDSVVFHRFFSTAATQLTIFGTQFLTRIEAFDRNQELYGQSMDVMIKRVTSLKGVFKKFMGWMHTAESYSIDKDLAVSLIKLIQIKEFANGKDRVAIQTTYNIPTVFDLDLIDRFYSSGDEWSKILSTDSLPRVVSKKQTLR